MATVMITGGTGMIGTALSTLLADNGYNVIILSRNPLQTAKEHNYKERNSPFRHNGRIYYSRWDIDNQHLDSAALAEADYIVHLAGAGVADKRWTTSRKKLILESRTKSSSLLVKSLKEHSNKVKAVISASAIGWYGQDKGKPFTEDDPPGW
jgi:NAD dependent epimerase/dehydratase family enzyme